MAARETLLPLFLSSGTLVPSGSILLAARDAPHQQLLHDCARNETPFAVVYFGDEGIADVGCAAVMELSMQGDMLLCQAFGLGRFDLLGTVSFEGNRQRVRSGGREGVFAQEGEPLSVPYAFARARRVEEPPAEVHEDLRAAVLEALLRREDEEGARDVREAFEDGLDGGLSFWLLDRLVPDDTAEGNRLRLDFLKKRSENKRFRMLRDLLENAAAG